MLINVKMMTEEAYATLQKNYKEVYENILKHPSDSTWLEGYLGFYPYETKKYLIEDFDLEDSEDYSEVAFENSVTLYEHLKDLPQYVLCSNRFWGWINFEKAYKQSQHSTRITSPKIIREWWLGNNERRALMLGVFSRYYFRIKATIDPESDDKYKYSRRLYYGTQGQEIYRAFAYRNIGMLSSVCIGVIKAIIDAEESYGYIPDRQSIRALMKDASRIGSVMLIDDLSQDEIYEIIYRKLEKRITTDLVY